MRMFTVALCAVGLAQVPAFSQPTRTAVVVSYADLDLRSQAGRARLDKRLDRAVARVCLQTDGYLDLRQRMAIQRCAKSAQTDLRGPRALAISGVSERTALAQ